MIQHTPEPWKYEGEDDGDFVVWGASPNDDFIGNVGARIKEMMVIIDLDLANARRIVACVNACSGITTEQLNSIGSGGINSLISSGADAVRLLEKEKTKNEVLMDALKIAQSALAHCKADIGYSHQQIMAAIAINDAMTKCEDKS